MAPAPLKTSSSSPRTFGFINGAISSAASPLQANFNLSCRSPVRPTHDGGAANAAGAPDSYSHHLSSSSSPSSPSAARRGSTPHALLLSPLRSSTSGAAAAAAAATKPSRTSSSFLEPPPRQFGQLSSPSTRTWPLLLAEENGEHTVVGENVDEDDDDDDGAVNDRSWFLPQPSPSLAPVSRLRQRQEDSKLGVISAVNIIVGKTIGVGAYSVPSAIFEGVGSVGMALLVWVVGSLISFCGLAVYLDLGTAIPRSGGERVYLERIFRRPRMLATCMFMAYVVLLGFSTPNAIVLGEYALYALDVPPNRWNVRTIAVVSVTALCYVHARHPRLGLKLINVLGAAKMLMLVIVVLSGIAGGILGVGSDRPLAGGSGSGGHGNNSGSSTSGILMGHHLDPDMIGHMPPMVGAAVASAATATVAGGISTARRNFQDIWAGSSSQPYDYATALLKVIYCFRGYSTANQVLSDIKDPVRTLRVAAPLALVLVSLSYLAINVAFFLVVDKEEFRSAGVVVAGLFFRNLFGDGAGAHVLPIFVIISAAGNIAATSFAQARVNEELAKDGLLPFAAFWTTTTKPTTETTTTTSTPTGAGTTGSNNSSSGSSRKDKRSLKTPTPSRGLLLHWLVSVIVIVVPPPGKIYNFLVDIGGYPVSVISVAIATGLLYLHNTPSERWASPMPAPRLAIIVFATSNCLLLIMPWIPPAGGRGENERFASYAYPTTALAVIGSGALFWLWWRYRGAGWTTANSSSRRTGAIRGSGIPRGGGRLSPPGWDRLKSAMAGVSGLHSSDENSSSSSSSSNSTLSSADDEDDDFHSARDLLLSENGTGSSQPPIHFTNLRRRAPCGCPSLH